MFPHLKLWFGNTDHREVSKLNEVGAGGVDIRRKKGRWRKANDIILRIIQAVELSRNYEEAMGFRAVILNICYCCGSFTGGKTLLSVIAFNAQNDSQEAQASSSQIFLNLHCKSAAVEFLYTSTDPSPIFLDNHVAETAPGVKTCQWCES